MPAGLSQFLPGLFEQLKKPTGLKNAYQQIESLLPTKYNDPYLSGAQSHYQRVMDPNYQAYSGADLEQMYQTQADRYGQAFKQQDDQMAARLANQGLAGSGAGFGYWSDQSKGQKQQLSDLWNNLNAMNIEATRADRSNAFGMTPALSSAYMSGQTMPLNTWMQYANLLGADEARKLQEKAQRYQQEKDSASGFGGFVGGLLDFIF
jgi:hypothetical protein